LSEQEKEKRNRGRPIGFRLSVGSKRAISESKMGQTHTQETKDKISRSLIIYFRMKNPLSAEIEKRYCGYNDDNDTFEWMDDVRDALDDIDDVLTEKVMRNKRRVEISCGYNIEYFGHGLTPEIMLLFKEFCKLNNLDPLEFLNDFE
jgi:hypothetical protein